MHSIPSDVTDTDRRRAAAIAGARAAVERLQSLGVSVLVAGSLAKGTFRRYSDVDFLVTSCPRDLKYAIEGIVEDCLGGIPFDVVYLDEIPAWKVASFTGGAKDVRDIG